MTFFKAPVAQKIGYMLEKQKGASRRPLWGLQKPQKKLAQLDTFDQVMPANFGQFGPKNRFSQKMFKFIKKFKMP